MFRKCLLATLLCLMPAMCSSRGILIPTDSLPLPSPSPTLIRHVEHDEACNRWVDSVMGSMSLRERIGQLFIYTIAPTQDKANKDLLQWIVRDYKVGGLLFSGGQAKNQAILTNEAQDMADIPLLITFDGEWGLAMRLRGTPSFPRNMVLGCIRDDSLLYAYGREVARELRELGVQVNFAPVADVNVNPENPVINTRSFGENPANVARKVVAYASGLESGGVLSVSKHFPGHGDTDVDSHKALPTLPFTFERLDSIELPPFREVIRAGLGGIMVGHLEVPAIEPERGLPSSLSPRVIDSLLVKKMQFRGLVFTDALAMGGASGNRDLCLKALLAGNDLLLVPRRLKEETDAVLDAIKEGLLSESEINRKCRKVLTYKYALGLAQKPRIQLSGLERRINTPRTNELIRSLKLAAITVAGKNAGQLLPLDATKGKVAVLCVGGQEKPEPLLEGLSRGGIRTDVFSLSRNPTQEVCRELHRKLSAYSRIVVCITDKSLSRYSAFFKSLDTETPVICLMFVPGESVPQQFGPAPDALILAHSADEDVQRHVAGILLGNKGADGRLSAGVGRWFAAGDGIDLAAQSASADASKEDGIGSYPLDEVDEIALEGINKGAYPGCQIVVLKDGKEIYNKAFGTHTARKGRKEETRPVTTSDIYDIASLTKTSATLLAVMKLYDEGRIGIDDRVAGYLPFLKGTDKQNITIRQLLLHESGLPSTILFYRYAIDEENLPVPLFTGREGNGRVRIGRRTWGYPSFSFRAGLTSKVRTDSCTLQVSDSLWLNSKFKQDVLRLIAETPLLSKRYRYSCVGFILLQQLVEAVAGMPMDEFLAEEFYAPMGLSRTGYRPLRFAANEEIVPSAADPFLRKTTLQGYVHDESAAFMGGVSGNAGLFSTAREQASIYHMILDGGVKDGRRYLSEETCRIFTTTTSRTSRRGLGFDKPDKRNPGKSPCCEEAPASVYGHTGFTGTCAWVDPGNRIVYIFLCNRTYPDAWNNRLMTLNIRTRIQEVIYKALYTRK